jgi:hypothetical protein
MTDEPKSTAETLEEAEDMAKSWCRDWVKVDEALNVLTDEVECSHDLAIEAERGGNKEDAKYFTDKKLSLEAAINTLEVLEDESFDKMLYAVENFLKLQPSRHEANKSVE